MRSSVVLFAIAAACRSNAKAPSVTGEWSGIAAGSGQAQISERYDLILAETSGAISGSGVDTLRMGTELIGSNSVSVAGNRVDSMISLTLSQDGRATMNIRGVMRRDSIEGSVTGDFSLSTIRLTRRSK